MANSLMADERRALAHELRALANRLDPPTPSMGGLGHLTADDCTVFARRLRHLSISRFVDNVAVGVDKVAELLRHG